MAKLEYCSFFLGLSNMTAEQIGYMIGTLAAPFLWVLVIGAAYYLVKKRSIPFRQAVRNRWVIIASLALFLLSLGGRSRSRMERDSSHDYPESVAQGFMEGCIRSTKALDDSEASEAICSCIISEIQEAYTYGEFKEIAAEMERSKTRPDELEEIAMSCTQDH